MRVTIRLMPPDQRDWSRAMTAELDHIEDDVAGLRWAMGCLFAGARMRVALCLNPARWSPVMRRKIMMSCGGLLGLVLISAGSIYATMKPYQEVRLIAWWKGEGKPPSVADSMPVGELARH